MYNKIATNKAFRDLHVFENFIVHNLLDCKAQTNSNLIKVINYEIRPVIKEILASQGIFFVTLKHVECCVLFCR